MHGSSFTIQRMAVLAAAALLISLLMAGCAGMGTGSDSVQTTDRLSNAADTAWSSKDFAKSELFYSRLLQRPDLTAEQRLSALKRLAYASSVLGHYHESEDALQSWAASDPNSEKDWRWQKLYADALIGLGKGDKAKQHLAILRIRKDMPEKVRLNAGLQLAALYRREADNEKSLDTLAALYADTEGRESRAFLEQRLMTDLEKLPQRDMDTLAGFVTPDNQYRYPYALIAFERARKKAESDAGQWGAAWPVMRRIVSRAELVDTAGLESVLASMEARLGAPQSGFVLALPLSGRYASVGWKILRGAGAAQWQLAQAGASVDVKVVNTDSPGWTSEVPAGAGIMGGPLRRSALEQAERAGLLNSRVTFAFVSDLGTVKEGVQAWRFFGSPRDQVGAMIDFCTSEMGIDSFGVISPDEEYGRRMARIFSEEAARRNGHVVRTETYPPGNHPAWGESVRDFLQVNQGVGAENPFRAVFIPDTLTQASLLIPHFFFYEENRMLILGPSMWSQGVGSGREFEEKYFNTAVFPDGWKDDSPGARRLASVLEAQGLGAPDYWTALGYDFVRFAARIGNFKRVDPAEVNSRLASASAMEFSLAPISWDAQGTAGQKAWLFSPDKKGQPVPVDPAELANRIEQAGKFREQRLDVIKEEKEKKAARQR